MRVGDRGARGESVVVPGLTRQPGCLRCPQERLAGRNFCGGCGNPLRRRCRRQQVTVLFADVSGFTALSERLDPEQVSQILDEAFAIILHTVHEHDGRVNQFLGDGAMAIFVESPGDDHTARALRAALALQERLAPLRARVRRLHDLDFRMRVTINTGPVVMGTIGADLRTDYTAAGETTDTAARLLAVAGPGQIVVSERTRDLAPASFAFRAVGLLATTGGTEPAEVFALVHDAPLGAESSDALALPV